MTFHNFIYSFKKENLIPLNITLVYSGKKKCLIRSKIIYHVCYPSFEIIRYSSSYVTEKNFCNCPLC